MSCNTAHQSPVVVPSSKMAARVPAASAFGMRTSTVSAGSRRRPFRAPSKTSTVAKFVSEPARTAVAGTSARFRTCTINSPVPTCCDSTTSLAVPAKAALNEKISRKLSLRIPFNLPDVILGDLALIVAVEHVHDTDFFHGDRRKLTDGDIDNRAAKARGDVAKYRARRLRGHIDHVAL